MSFEFPVNVRMPLDWGDYRKDTVNLNAVAHGAYFMLIGRYWSTGHPLPDDDDALWRIACCDSKDEWLAIRPKVVRLFVPHDGALHHKRVDRELLNVATVNEQRRAAGKASADARKGQKPVPEPTTVRTTVPTTVPTSVQIKPQICSTFETFWADYPRKKEGRGACAKAWTSALKRASPNEIIAGLRRYPFNQDFLPMAATWLNQSRWMGESDTAPLTVDIPTRRTPTTDLAEMMRGFGLFDDSMTINQEDQ